MEITLRNVESPDKEEEGAIRKKIENIFTLIFSFEPGKRDEGKFLLSRIKSEKELRELASFSMDKSFKIKYCVIEHLGKFEYGSVIRDIILFLSDTNVIIQRKAGRTLDRISSEDKYDYLLPLLTTGSHSSRLYAIKTLGRGKQVNAVLPLLDITGDSDPDIRYEVIDALRHIADNRADEAIIRCLKDEKEKVRYAAAIYCGSSKAGKSCEALFELLKDANSRVRSASVWAIGQIGNLSCVSRLKDYLEKEEDENVKHEIFKAFYRAGEVKLLETEGELKTSGISTKPVSDWYFALSSPEDNMNAADICLFLEGSYPWVSGGVSSWIRDLLGYFEDLTFSLVCIGSSGSEIKEFKYRVPPNVIYLSEINLFDFPPENIFKKSNSKKQLDVIFNFITSLEKKEAGDFEKIFKELGVLEGFKVNLYDLLFSREAWRLIHKLYRGYEDLPFLEFLWSYKAMVLPVYNILNSRIPPASLFYPVLTGYAGFAAALACIYYKKPLLLTEHGIYHRERMIEINKSDWIYESRDEGFVTTEMLRDLKKVWNNFYGSLSYIAYKFSHSITSLFEANAEMQIEGGAEREKIVIIPNGIDIASFENLKKDSSLHKKEEFTVGLAGRIVEIKDIKTFIWSSRIILDKMPGKVKFLVMGAYDEDPDYADECRALKRILDMESVMKFTGHVNLKEYYKKTDLLVFTSISEGQPLAMMEAMSAGIPCIATDVGACRELLYGKKGEDEKLGRCGIITGVHSPHEIAGSVMEVLSNKNLYKEMSETGKTRMKKYYRKKDVFEMYRAEFEKFLEKKV